MFKILVRRSCKSLFPEPDTRSKKMQAGNGNLYPFLGFVFAVGYYGTWSKKSSVVGPQHPFKKDLDLDYDVDSDEEWEEEDSGESLSDCDKDDEEEYVEEGHLKSDDENESEDGFFVPNGYLSENEVNEEVSDKVLEVEQKYNEVGRPVYQRRNEIIQTIPDFWLTAFLSHPAFVDLLNEEDQKIFKYLVSLDVEDCKDVKSGYSITFNFSPNPYFEDTKLTKTYSFSEEGTTNISGYND